MANQNNLKPYNLEAECACICAMIKNKKASNECLAHLTAEDFYDKRNEAAFRILVSIYDKKLDLNEVTIYNEAAVLGLDNLVDKDYLRSIQEYQYASTNFEGLLKIVSEYSIIRKLFKEFNNLTNTFSTNNFGSLEDFLNVSKLKIDNVLQQRQISDFLTPDKVIEDLSKKIEDAHKNFSDQDVTGVDTGFEDINKLTLGFQKGNMIVLAARPGLGKTSLALNIAQHVSESKQGSIAFFSQEMGAVELANRIISFKSGIPSKDLIRGKFTDFDRARISSAQTVYRQGKIYVDETPGIEWMDLVAKAHKFKDEHDDFSLMIIDHIGLIKNKAMDNKPNISRTQIVGYVSKNLKVLAKELDVPILVLCQLSRAVDSNPGKRPLLSNLRESGDIEQDADLVLGMSVLDPKSALAKKMDGSYKGGYAGNKKTPEATDEDKLEAETESAFNRSYEKALGNKNGDGDSGLMLIETLKNRNGPKLKIALLWNGKLTCFNNLERNKTEDILSFVKDLS